MKILIADKLSLKAIEELKRLSKDVIYCPEYRSDDILNNILDFDILIVRSTKVTKETIQRSNKLSLIIRAGAGVNTIDIFEANKKGIFVSNCPGKNTDAVAELAIGHLIAADRRIINASIDMKNGKWCKKEYQDSKGLKGRILGIVGFGSIGKAVAKRALAFQMKVIAYSRSLTEEKAKEFNVEYCDSIEKIAEISDAITIHLALKAETKHIIDEKFFNLMKDNSIFINTSRGDIVNTAHLMKAILKKNIRVGLDVYENEPSSSAKEFNDIELVKEINCTPHIGASTKQSSEAIADEVVNIIKNYIVTGKPLNTVNIQKKTLAKSNLIVRHYEHIGVLANVFNNLRMEKINVEEVENIIFEDDRAACCIMKLDSIPSSEFIKNIMKNTDIIDVTLR